MKGAHLGLWLVWLATAVAAADLTVEALPPRVYGGATLRPAVTAPPARGSGALRLAWMFTWSDRVVKGEMKTFPQMGKATLEIPAPNVRVRVPLSIRLDLFGGGERIAGAERALDVFPSPVFEVEGAGLADVPYARPGRLAGIAPALKVLGSSAAVRHFEGDVVLVHAAERVPALASIADAIRAHCRRGGTAILFGAGGPSLLGRDASVTPPAAPAGRVLVPGYHALVNLREGDLAAWAPGNAFADGALPWPGGTTARVVIDAPGPIPRALLIEERIGSGRALLCAAALPDALGRDPAADIVLANLLRPWPRTGRFGGVRLAFGHGAKSDRALRSLCGDAFAESMPAVLIGDDALVADEALPRVLRDGGTALFLGLSEDGVAALNTACGKQLSSLAPTLRLRESRRPPEGAPHALTKGVRPEDMALLNVDGATGVVDVEGGVRAEAGNASGVLSEFKCGGVRLVFFPGRPAPKEAAAAWGRVVAAVVHNLRDRVAPKDGATQGEER